MSLSRPTLQEIESRTRADLAAGVEGASPTLRRGILPALSRALAAAVHQLYGYVSAIAQLCHPLTATGSVLDLWASLWGVVRKPVALSGGTVIVSGMPGTPIPADSRVQSLDGEEFVILDAVALDGSGHATVTVAGVIAGADSNLAAGETLSFISPIPGVDVDGEVAEGGIVGGADLETDDALRIRLQQRVQNPPHGGNQADYVGWALSVPGVTRAWCQAAYAGPGTVRVFVADDSYVGANLADAPLVAAVASYIESVRPIGAVILVGSDVVSGVDVRAPIRAPMNFSLSVYPDTVAIRQQVAVNLGDLLLREAAPEGSIRISRLREAIGAAPLLYDYNLVSPAGNVTAGAGQISTLGTITWL